jgi:hypothetical protein
MKFEERLARHQRLAGIGLVIAVALQLGAAVALDLLDFPNLSRLALALAVLGIVALLGGRAATGRFF